MFQGVINHRDDNPLSNGGFASFRTLPDERIRDLSAFNALEMRIKTDGRPYIANFRCADHGADQLWQIRLITEPMKWTTVAFPITDLMLTKRGRVEVYQLPINKETVNSVCILLSPIGIPRAILYSSLRFLIISQFGVLLADRRNGPFRFEIQYLRALRSFIPEHYTAVGPLMMEETYKSMLFLFLYILLLLSTQILHFLIHSFSPFLTFVESQALLNANKSPEELRKEAALEAYKRQRQEAKVN